jgi:alanine racemase
MGAVTERVWAEIELGAVSQNFNYAQVRVGGSVGVMAVVKSNAYGHGAVPVAHELERQGVKAFGVATAEEGIELREAGISLPVVIIGSCFEGEIEPALTHGLSLSLSPGEIFWPIVETAKKLDVTAHVHLLVDTGMSRDGLTPEASLELAEHLAETPQIHLEGTYTHLATSMEADKSFCHEQLGRFNDVVSELFSRNIHPGILHSASSGGLFTLPSSHFDMVRQGISLYGMTPSAHVAEEADLTPAMTIKSRVMAIKEIGEGQSVGYLRQFVAKRPTRLATVSMGYADGLRVAMSNKGSVLINGRRAPVVGRVMMDCIVVDVTRLPSVRVGDEVVVIGKSGRNRIRAEEVADLCETSPYEIMCLLGRRVKRIYSRDGKRVIMPGQALPKASDTMLRTSAPAPRLDLS